MFDNFRFAFSFPLLLLLTACAGPAVQPANPDPGSSSQPLPYQVQQYQDACEGGDAISCAEMGLIYLDGLHGMAINHELANEYNEFACGQAVSWACTNLGLSFELGRGMASDHVTAAAIYHRGCELGGATSCTNLGLAHRYGRGIDKDELASRQLFTHACELGHGRGCTEMGQLLRFGLGGEADETLATDYYARACDLDHPFGCSILGWHFERGRGVEIDEERSTHFYRRGCELNDHYGCTNLGRNHEAGRGVDVNETTAAELYQRACDGDYLRACYFLARLYRDGRGVDTDPDRSVSLLEKSCDGYPQSCTDLGLLFRAGSHVDKDEDRALQFFATACQAGHTQGCRLVAESPEMDGWADLLQQGCSLDANSCLPAARALIKRGQQGDARLAHQLLEQGCDADSFASCANLPAFRHPELRHEYSAACQEDDGVACLNLAAVSAADNNVYGHYCTEEQREIPDDETIDTACADGDLEACWLRGTRLVPPRGAAIIGVLAGGGGYGFGVMGQRASEDELQAIQAEFRQACDDGDANSCIDLANHLRANQDDPAQVLSFEERACDLGSPRGCRRLAFTLLRENDGEPDAPTLARAKKLLDDACDADDSSACARRAELLVADNDPDHRRIVTLFNRACSADTSRACMQARSYFEDRGDDLHNRACFFHYTLQDCTLDSWAACHVLENR